VANNQPPGTGIAVPPGRISAIVNGERAVSVDTALGPGKYFGVSPEIWVGLQADYDLRLAKRTVGGEVEKRVHRYAACLGVFAQTVRKNLAFALACEPRCPEWRWKRPFRGWGCAARPACAAIVTCGVAIYPLLQRTPS